MAERDPLQPFTVSEGSFIDDEQSRNELKNLEFIAEWMDRRFVDPLLGIFVPGGGNAMGAFVGLYGVYVAVRLSVHPVIIARMLLNLALDALIGTVPFLGWIGDFLFQAHVRNLRLLKARGQSGRATAGDWLLVLGCACLLVFSMLLPFLLVGWIIYLLAQTGQS